MIIPYIHVRRSLDEKSVIMLFHEKGKYCSNPSDKLGSLLSMVLKMKLKKGKNPYRRLFWPNWRSILHDVCIVLHRRARNLMIWSMHNWMDFMHWPSENCDKLNTYALKGLHTLLPTGNIDCSTNNGVPLRKSNNVEQNLLFLNQNFPFCWERLQLV